MARKKRVVRTRDMKGRFYTPYVLQHALADSLIVSADTIFSFRFMDLPAEIRYVAPLSHPLPLQTANSLPETECTTTRSHTLTLRSSQKRFIPKPAARSATATS